MKGMFDWLPAVRPLGDGRASREGENSGGLIKEQCEEKGTKQAICHYEPSGGCQTLNLPCRSIFPPGGHFDNHGNPLHAGDHFGVCEATSTPVPPTKTQVPPTATTPALKKGCTDPAALDYDMWCPLQAQYPRLVAQRLMGNTSVLKKQA